MTIKKDIIVDILMIIGLSMVSYGLHCIYPPSMYIITGLFIVFLSWPRRRE